jgi:hypothetical protein
MSEILHEVSDMGYRRHGKKSIYAYREFERMLTFMGTQYELLS